MTTTAVVSAVAHAAGNGGTSTPVRLVLQASTVRVSVELRVQTTRPVTTSVNDVSDRQLFQAHFATSAQDLSAVLSTVPNRLRGCARDVGLHVSPDLTDEARQADAVVRGPDLYLWYEYPRSTAAHTVTIYVTEHAS